MTDQIRPENVTYLDLSNNAGPELITRITFNKFRNLEGLHLANTGIKLIEDYAFHMLVKLKRLDLSHNLIRYVDSNLFPSDLEDLLIGQNALESLDGFDVDKFVELRLLDVSNNKIKVLPQNLLNRSVRVIVSGNLVNCSKQRGLKYTAKVLCLSDVSNEIMSADSSLSSLPVDNVKSKNKCSFACCVFWIFGACWFGVILGNVWKIKTLTCPSKRKSLHKSTQYGKGFDDKIDKLF